MWYLPRSCNKQGGFTMKRVIFKIGLSLGVLFLCIASSIYAADIEAVLDDAAGASKFSVKDSTNTEVSHIDSDGNMVIKTVGIFEGGTIGSLTDGHLDLTADTSIDLNAPTILKAGTATAGTAPLKFTPGTLLTAPEVGALECSTSGLFHTTLGDRRSLLQSSQPIIASTTVANTTTETTIYTTTIAANELIVGETIWTHLFGYMSTHGASDTVIIRVKIGGTTILTITTTAGNVTNEPLSIEPCFTVRSIGATGTIFAYGKAEIANKGKTIANIATTTIDTTAVSNITVTVQWSNAYADATITIAQGLSEVIW